MGRAHDAFDFYQVHSFRSAERGVNSFRLTKVLPCSDNAEEVAGGRADQRRPWSTQQHIIRVIESESNLAKDVLLGIRRLTNTLVSRPKETPDLHLMSRRDPFFC